MIGRDDVVALAERRMGVVRTGPGHLLFLAGEAGIGKTRLLGDICEVAAREGFVVFTVGAYPRDVEVAGSLLLDLATELVRRGGAADVGRRLAHRLQSGGGSGDGSGDAYRQRRLLVVELAELLVSLGSGEHPILLALEDLHWADDLTLAVLERVARRLTTVSLLIVGTYRSDELYPRVPMRSWRARLLTQRLAEEATLQRLGHDDTAAMAAAIANRALPAELIAALYERSDGIPLHIEEFLTTLTAPTGDDRAVPDTLAEAVLARARDLGESARRLAGAASVIGRSFDVDLLAAVTGDAPEDIDVGLRELEVRFFVQPRGRASAYDFRHALIRDALYADLPPLRRRDLHLRAATAAIAAGLSEALISDQYERAQQPAMAYRYAIAAATRAAGISAHREAVELYRRAQRTTPTETPDDERADLLAALAGELAAIDDNAAASAAYAQAHAIRCDRGDDEAAAALVAPLVAVRHLLGADRGERVGVLKQALSTLDTRPGKSPSDLRGPVLAALSAVYMLDRCLEDSIEFGRRAHAIAVETGDRGTRLDSEVTLGSALVFGGRMDEGWQLLENATREAQAANLEVQAARGYRMIGSSASVLVEYDRAMHWLRQGIAYADRTERFNDRHYMAAHLGHVAWAAGDWSAAGELARHALADGQGGVTTRITALHVLGYLALGRADWTAARQQLDEARQLGERMRELQRLSPALWGLAETALYSGRPAEAVEWCGRGYAASAAVADAAYLFPYVVTGIRAHLALEDVGAARDWFDRCDRALRHRDIPGTIPALDHARGLLQLAQGQPGQARETLAAANLAWDARQRFWEGTQIFFDRARAARQSRRTAEAAALDAEGHRRAAQAGASALLGPPSPNPSSTARTPEVLTARELEVARLVATGRTNREIAQSLFISPKTVAAHIEHILAKLGAARRTEIASWATTHAPAASDPIGTLGDRADRSGRSG